ncbi:cbb3-type cytochrome oxidase subunit 3 [Emcibacter sp.]|uniref:cbb3-type cytochrome oxidase subunit 3 n=1 Tax=Emcibacter sp. TaxID=1979954 RepID=UPI003A92B9EE
MTLFSHETLVYVSKTYGLFYLIAVYICVVFYAFRPGNKKKFRAAAQSILDDKEE